MMKRAIVLAIVALFAVGVSASATVVSTTIYPGFNMIGPPVVPFSPDPASVFAGIPLAGTLTRFDASTQGYVLYDPDFPEDYGGVLLGDGAWLRKAGGGTLTWSYDGAPDGLPDSSGVLTDMWLSLPQAGFTLIAHPFNHPVDAANVRFTDGIGTLDWQAAVAAGWFNGVLVGFEATVQGYFTVGPDPDSYDRTQLEPFYGYWVRTYKANLAMIVPA